MEVTKPAANRMENSPSAEALPVIFASPSIPWCIVHIRVTFEKYWKNFQPLPLAEHSQAGDDRVLRA